MQNNTNPSADEISLILSGDSADAQHPKVLAIGLRVCAGELTHSQARPLLRQAMIDIETQERSWQCAFVN